MAQDMEWGPSIWGQRFTGSGSWTLRLRGDLVELTVGWGRHTTRIAGANPLRIRQGVFWTDLTLFPDTLDTVTVDGIPNRHGQAIADAIQAVVAEQKREAARRAEEERKLSRRLRFDAAYALIHDWHKSVHNSFAKGVVLRLQQTFRCPQALCDVSSHFVSKNPAQIPKNVSSETSAHGPVLHAFQVAGKDQIQDAVLGFLKGLSEQVRAGTTPRGRDGKLSVFVLGRYNDDQRRYVPSNWAQACGDVLTVQFMTMHASKGSEADYVILPSMVWGGFPSLRQDDPVLALAMPGSDTYPFAEERRLFYVALTRARRAVAMFTVRGHQSPFLTELVEDKLVVVTDTTGTPVKDRMCPKCKRGVIERKTGRYGVFYGCSAFPKCRYKP
jgi:hypothetical protein